MPFADDSTLSIGALNQRSTLLRISSLPMISTSTAGMSVIPSSTVDQLDAETRKRQRPPPFDDQLDDVAGQHERQGHQHRQVRGRQRVEHERRRGSRGRAPTIGWPSASSPASAAISTTMPDEQQRGVVEERLAALRCGASPRGRRRRFGRRRRMSKRECHCSGLPAYL